MAIDLGAYIQKCDTDKAYFPRSIMVQQHGEVIGSHLWLLDERRNIHSITKSITSCAVGVALRDGYFKLDDKVASFFEADLPPSPDPRLLRMTVEHFLTMTAGFKEPMHAEFRKAIVENFPKYILAREISHEPGTHFSYDTACAYLMGCILQKTVGISLKQFVYKNILEPIGIFNPPWPESRDGVCLGGSGIMLTTEEMVTLGQFWLQKGAWEGRQLVPRDYFERAVSTLVVSPENDEMTERGYGYYFWTDLWKQFPASYHGFGSWGKYIFVIPEKDAVIAVTAHDATCPVTAISTKTERYVETTILPQL